MMQTKLQLKKMLEAKAPDVTLQADDILFVPLSGARVAASRGLEAAISTAAGLAIIAARPKVAALQSDGQQRTAPSP